MALPVGGDFWLALFEKARAEGWGLIGYEQDWMDVQTERLPALTRNATLGRTWLLEMGLAADAMGISIQYCMSWCRHILASVEVPAVTQARASGDYRAGNMLWQRLGIVSLLLYALMQATAASCALCMLLTSHMRASALHRYALGLAPSKDTFWSITHQPGNIWGERTVEPHPRLQAAVATLSRGPVAPSDAIGRSDRDLIMRSANSAGTLLQPDEPAIALDIAIVAAARGSPIGELLPRRERVPSPPPSRSSSS